MVCYKKNLLQILLQICNRLDYFVFTTDGYQLYMLEINLIYKYIFICM